MSHHRSSFSQYSQSFSQNLDDFTDAELIKQVHDLKQQIKVINLENEILEKTIMRLEPALMNGVQQALDYANRLASSSSLNVGSFVKSQKSGFDFSASPSRLLQSPSKVSTTRRVDSSARMGGTVIFGTGPRINVLERSELVTTEKEILVMNMEKERTKAAKQQALLKAQLEEIDVREVDIQKACVMFNQEVIVDGWDKIAQRIPAEIWIRFMMEWVKITDSQIGKLRLRTSTLNTQYSKLKGQIKDKAELSESLCPVDFEKLEIENGECVAIIDKKLQQLGELKKMTGEANLNLSVHKKAMMEQNNYLSSIIKTIKDRQRMILELDKERDTIKIQADSLAQQLDEVKKVRDMYEVPEGAYTKNYFEFGDKEIEFNVTEIEFQSFSALESSESM
ncbi:unnamed protein product [Diatraea saccharalis]|uniref:Cilia- and flagella-associated protein 263 n=1 Tax=Diatraea saccharalis TaxID=40085 RepID=A0A9N9WIA9_9NEOP|nr:unnamed protein product [Diatraea saccharalis]